MILDFPNSPPPQSGDTYTAPNGQLYVYDGEKWIGATGGTTQGQKGDKGDPGEPGPKGDPGDPGTDLLWVFSGPYDNDVRYNEGVVVTYNGGTYRRNDYNLTFNGFPPGPGFGEAYWQTLALPGEAGAAGAPGVGIQLLGTVENTGLLDPSYTGNIGDAYIVTADGGQIWIWDGTVWYDAGQIVGPQGPKGDQGEPGITPDLSGYATQTWVQSQNYLTSFTEADTLDTVTGRGASTSNNLTTGNILPVSDNTKYLGSPSQRWHTLYVGPGSIDIDGATIQKVDDQIVVNNPIKFSTTDSVFDGSYTQLSNQPTYATVASTGSYTDLINKPTLFDGNYNSLSNKPTIPDNTNQLTNGAGYITSSALSSYATQQWVQDQSYITGINYGDVTTALGFTPIQASSLSVTTNSASGGGSLSYSNGTFTFTPAVQYSLPTASTTVLGGVKVDGTTITITDGVITSTATGGANALSDLTDVLITTTPTTGYVLKWNGTKWAPAIDSTSGGGGTDADTLDGFDGSYYLNYANFSGSPSLTVTTTTANGGGTLSYSSGTFTFAPADLSSYATTSSLSNYATTSSLSNYVTSSTLSSYAYISHTNLSVTTDSASGGGTLSYNNSNGVFTFRPADLSSYATQTYVTSQGYITGITSGDVTTALGYTPYNSTNPSGYTTNTGTVTSVSGTGTVNGITLTGTVTSSGSLTLGGTLSGIGNNQLTNSTISGVALGGSLFNLTAGTGISYSSGTTYNGSTAITINNSDTGSAQNIFKTVAVSGQTSVTAASNTATLTLVAGTGITLTTDNTAKSVTVTAGGGSPTFTNVTVTGQIIEPFNTYSTAITGSPTITFNCSTGNIWRVNPTGGPGSAWTAAFTNVQITTGQATNITMIIGEGSTPFIPSAISINGTAVTPTWQGGVAPTPSANKTEAIGYSVLQTGASTYIAYAQMVTFG